MSSTHIRNTRQTVMVIAAHPDDETLGCGGTIAGLSEYDALIICILGEGVTSRYASREEAPKSAITLLENQAKAAGQILGASSLIFGGLPDNRFDSVPLLDITKIIEGWIAEYDPDVVYTHCAGDVNVDHCITYRSVLVATRPTSNCQVRELYSFEVPSSTEWAFQTVSPSFHPNTFVDITKTIDRKIRALEAYESEIRTFPHPRSPEILMSAANRWGSVISVEYAEAFQLIRSVKGLD